MPQTGAICLELMVVSIIQIYCLEYRTRIRGGGREEEGRGKRREGGGGTGGTIKKNFLFLLFSLLLISYPQFSISCLYSLAALPDDESTVCFISTVTFHDNVAPKVLKIIQFCKKYMKEYFSI